MARPRLAGERYPSGRLKADKQETAPPGIIRRMIHEAKRGAADQRLGSALGILRLNDIIDDAEFAAGEEFGKRCGVYDRVKGLPPRHASSPAYQAGRGCGDGEPSDNAVAVATARFDEAVEVLGAVRGATRIVSQVVIYDLSIVPADHDTLRAGLAALAVKWGYRGGRKARA